LPRFHEVDRRLPGLLSHAFYVSITMPKPSRQGVLRLFPGQHIY